MIVVDCLTSGFVDGTNVKRSRVEGWYMRDNPLTRETENVLVTRSSLGDEVCGVMLAE